MKKIFIKNNQSILVYLLLVSILIFFGCSQSKNEGGSSNLYTNTSPEEVTSFIALLNQHRVSVGCTNELTYLSSIENVAVNHSADMYNNDYFSHTNLQNQSAGDRLSDGNVSYRGWAENIAYSSNSTGEIVFNMWLNSSGHRANMENCSWTHHGVGHYNGYWTHNFIIQN